MVPVAGCDVCGGEKVDDGASAEGGERAEFGEAAGRHVIKAAFGGDVGDADVDCGED